LRRLVPSALLSHDGGLGDGRGGGEVEVVGDVGRGVMSKNFGDSLDAIIRPRSLDGEWGGRGGFASFDDRRSTQKK
jgi:hypothetical protein